MTPLAALSIQYAGKAADAGLGLLMGDINDRRQLKQQEKLQELQIKGQKEMTDYNTSKQLQMWKDTNYPAQVEQLKLAGLNPGLLYGIGGGGGTTASISQGSVSSGEAPKGGREMQDMMGMGLQLQLIQAQKEVLESQADKNKAEAEKTRGIDTTEAQTRVDSLLQGIDNARQQHQIMKLDITLKNIENYEKQATQDDRIDYIEYQTKIAKRQLDLITNEANISTATINQKIDIIRAEAVGALLKNELTKSQTDKTKSDIQINKETIRQWIQANMREWDKMSQENQKIAIQKLLADFNTDPVNKATENISRLIDNIFFITQPPKPGTTINVNK